jgi:hypothetical protein
MSEIHRNPRVLEFNSTNFQFETEIKTKPKENTFKILKKRSLTNRSFTYSLRTRYRLLRKQRSPSIDLHRRASHGEESVRRMRIFHSHLHFSQRKYKISNLFGGRESEGKKSKRKRKLRKCERTL